MVNLEILLIILPVIVSIGSVLYIFFREKMVKNSHKTHDYSRFRVIKLTIINVSLNILMATYFLFFFNEISIRSPTTDYMWVWNLFVLILCMIFYGSGIYITSILIEAYTKHKLETVDSFKTQYTATDLFHGPLSHILIYSGWIIELLIISLFEINTGLVLSTQINKSIIVAGGMLGLLYALLQIYNGTALYQFITGILSLTILLGTIIIKKVPIINYTISMYFLFFCVVFNTVLLSYSLLFQPSYLNSLIKKYVK